MSRPKKTVPRTSLIFYPSVVLARSHQAERSNAAVKGSTPSRTPTILSPKGAPTLHAAEVLSAYDGAASATPSTVEILSSGKSDIGVGGGDGGGGSGGGGGGGGGGGRGGDLNDVDPATDASMVLSSPLSAAPAEQLYCQPSPTSTLSARAEKNSGAELLQRRQHLLSSRAPDFSSSCPPASRRFRQLTALSASGEEDNNSRASQPQPTALPRTAVATAAASAGVGAARQRRRRHSPPIRPARVAGHSSASPTSVRVTRAAAASHAPERDWGKGERRKNTIGRSGGRAVSRRRASMGAGAGEGEGGGDTFQIDPFASHGRRRQGFDAAPYQTTVLFRDR